MGYAVLSDVHANSEALLAVFADLKKRNVDTIYFLGDAVGYGPDPDECVELLRDSCEVLLAGNHDWGVAGLYDTAGFNEFARSAVAWTKSVINGETLEILRSLPLRRDYEQEGISLVHATPCEPGKWHYLFSHEDAALNFGCFDTAICFVGHSHKPLVLEEPVNGPIRLFRSDISLSTDSKYIINTGSVGQPRDGDPRACYVVCSGDRIEFIRVPYDIQKTQQKMARARLPNLLIERLSYGM